MNTPRKSSPAFEALRDWMLDHRNVTNAFSACAISKMMLMH